MKHVTLLLGCVFYYTNLFCQSETKSNSEVIIIQAQGVPNPTYTKIVTNPNRTISDWNLAECYDALRMIEEKINHISKEDENYTATIKFYVEEKIKIQQQIDLLKTTKP